MKILVVEDDKTIASGLEYSLQQERYSTVICHDVASAKQVLAEDIDQFALCLSIYSFRTEAAMNCARW